MKRILFTAFIALVSNITSANIHEWTYQKESGSRIFKFHNPPLENPRDPIFDGVTLHVYCTGELPTLEVGDNSVSVIMGSRIYTTSFGDHDFSLSFDGGERITPPSQTRSKEGAESWDKIIQEIHNSQKIEAFDNGIKIATFYPKNDSYDQISDELLKCKAVRNMRKRWSKATESWNAPLNKSLNSI